MFGNDSLPCRNWSFGAKRPTMNADLAWEQLRAAHRYRNRLCELELDRRKLVDQATAEAYPEIQTADAEIFRLEAEIEAIRKLMKSANAKSRAKGQHIIEKAKIKVLREELKPWCDRRKAARKDAFENVAHRARLDQIDAANNDQRKQARAECGVYWGTYLAIENSCNSFRKGAPPRFMRWTGEGKLAVQLQGGLSPEEAYCGTDTRLRIERRRPHDFTTCECNACLEQRRLRIEGPIRLQGESASNLSMVHLRIGSNGRNPVWCSVPVYVHRELPADCRIKWAFLVIRRSGTTQHWSIVLSLADEEGWTKPDSSAGGAVGIDVGWRLVPDGLRVAYWIGDDGASGELILPERDFRHWSKAESIQGFRDTNFNAIRDKLADWLLTAPTGGIAVPDWLVDRTKLLRSWRSAARLAAVVIQWRGERFTGDDEIFAATEDWRKRDKHLLNYQTGIVRGLIARRSDTYRKFAAEMRRRYHTAVIEEMNLRELAQAPVVESEQSASGAFAEHRRAASCGLLLRCITESMAETVRADAKHTTMMCHSCGTIQSRFDGTVLMHTCEECATTWDQDQNAAKNLLRLGIASAPVPSETL